jgi:DNA-binding NarL/FixJ family response regulator
VRARILVVEDDSLQAINVATLLELEGRWICGCASTGERAVRLARTRRPDVVIMDVVLDGEIDGIEAARQIRSTGRCGLIFLTAYGDPATRERMRHLSPDAIIDKPASKESLVRAVEQALGHGDDPAPH